MPKTATESVRHALNGATMGTRWSALFYSERSFDAAPVSAALQKAVDEVDDQMSSWKPDSALMRLNRAPVDEWFAAPSRLVEVLRLAVRIGRDSGGAFDIGVGDAVRAWGFGRDETSPQRIRLALAGPRFPAHQALEFDGHRVRKRAPVTLDLNGIAKGYGVDRLAETLESFGILSGLAGIDGEMRAMGLRPDGEAWAIAIEEPDPSYRAAHSVVALQNAAIATSGDYRHWVEAGDQRLSHTMDPQRGAPLRHSPASVTVVMPRCAEADAWATAFMVMGRARGAALAQTLRIDALFLSRVPGRHAEAAGTGLVFQPAPVRPSARMSGASPHT